MLKALAIYILLAQVIHSCECGDDTESVPGTLNESSVTEKLSESVTEKLPELVSEELKCFEAGACSQSYHVAGDGVGSKSECLGTIL